MVREIAGIYETQIFPDLPAADNRLTLLTALEGTGISEAFFILHYLHSSINNAAGDVCEFGVAQGFTSALLANELLRYDRHLWLFDSFEGLSKPSDKDELIDDIFELGSIAKYERTMSYGKQFLIEQLSKVQIPPERVHVVEGFIEQLSPEVELPNQVCFAYVDFDLYEPIACALNLLHKSLSSGGSIIIDDYGFFSAGAKLAVDEFASAHASEYEVNSPPSFSGHFRILSKL